MTAQPISLRRPTKKPAANLFRVTAAITALTLPLLWLLSLWDVPLPPGCSPQGICLGIEHTWWEGTGWLARRTAWVELAAIACYLLVAIVRRKITPSAALRWTPLPVFIVALAIVGILSAIEPLGRPVLLWLTAPLVIYGVHHADPRAVLPVLLALAPTVVLNLLRVVADQDIYGVLPAATIILPGVVLGVGRLRRSQPRVDRFGL